MTIIAIRRSILRRPVQTLLLSASAFALAHPAFAAEVLFSTDRQHQVEIGSRVNQIGGVTQIRLVSGAILSFVDNADYRINADGSVDLYGGGVTVAGARDATVVVRMPDGVEGRVGGAGAAASFSVAEDGRSRGHVLTGSATIRNGGTTRSFNAGGMWASSGGGGLRQVVSNGAQSTPGAGDESAGARVADMARGGLLAAAENGLPVSLGDGLAGAGASGDILSAAQRVDAAMANPSIATFPADDLALLAVHAARLAAPYGGEAFPGAQADIIRAYLRFLADGRAGADFLPAYGDFLIQYLDLIRAGGLPSSLDGVRLADLHAFIAYTGRTTDFGALSEPNRRLVEAYLSFLASGGDANGFARSYTDLVETYFGYLRAGGDPAAFSGASRETVDAYIAFLADSGLVARLSVQDRALLDSWLAGGGFAFAEQYRVALDAYFDFLAAGNMPGAYGDIDAATLRSWLETLRTTGLWSRVLGARADFYAAFLDHLRAGGTIDAFAGLNANIFADYAGKLDLYYLYLLEGGTPSGYTALTQEQIAAYIAALAAAGAGERFLGDRAVFYAGYVAHLTAGGDPDLYGGLPGHDLPMFANALNAYAAHLAAGGLPGEYGALDLQTLGRYLQALEQSGQLAALLGGNAGLLNAYFAYLAEGGAVDRYAGLPVYAGYVTALNAYYAFLAGGGVPGDYTALTAEQISSYLAALHAAGGFAAHGSLASFFSGYHAFLASGGSAEDYAGIPVYGDYFAALAAYYQFLAAGGRPSAYTALTQAQIRAYLRLLDRVGILAAELGSDELLFVLAYLDHVETGASPDEFAQLPINNPEPALLAQGNVWLIIPDGPRMGVGQSATIEPDGRIVALQYTPGSNSIVSYDFDAPTYVLREHGRVGDNVAWTRYEAGHGGGVLSNANYHLLIGTAASALPAVGRVDYRLVGGTAPTDLRGVTGESGAFEGNLAVAFGATPRIGFDFDVYLGEQGWHVETQGAAAGAAAGGVALGADMRFQTHRTPTRIAGVACTAYCTASITGGLFGVGASEAGIQYVIDDNTGGRFYVAGNAVFGMGGTALPRIGVMPEPPAPPPPGYDGPFDALNARVDWVGGGMTADGVLLHSEAGLNAADFQLSPDGGLERLQYSGSGGQVRTRGTASVADSHDTADALIGRWADGTTQGRIAYTLTANQGLHYVMLRPTVPGFALPATGRIDYYQVAATRPTIADGSWAPGLFKADLAFLFGTTVRVAMEGDITMPTGGGEYVYRFATAGGIARAEDSTTILQMESGKPGAFGFSFNGDDGAGDCGASACLFSVFGGFAGADAGTIGLTYSALRSAGHGFGGAAIFAAGPERENDGGIEPEPPVSRMVRTEYFVADSGRNETLDTTITSRSRLDTAGYELSGGGEIVALKQDRWNLMDGIGTASNADSGTTPGGTLRWTRWTDGTLEHTRAGPQTPIGFTANQGYHIIAGVPATDLPTSGRLVYDLVGGTRPTAVSGAGAPGELLSGMAAVEFGGAAHKLGIELEFTQNGSHYAMQTPGGVANVSASDITIGSDASFRRIGAWGQGVTVDGVGCDCRPIWEGFLAGSRGEELAVMYTMQQRNGERLMGAAAFASGLLGGNITFAGR